MYIRSITPVLSRGAMVHRSAGSVLRRLLNFMNTGDALSTALLLRYSDPYMPMYLSAGNSRLAIRHILGSSAGYALSCESLDEYWEDDQAATEKLARQWGCQLAVTLAVHLELEVPDGADTCRIGCKTLAELLESELHMAVNGDEIWRAALNPILEDGREYLYLPRRKRSYWPRLRFFGALSQMGGAAGEYVPSFYPDTQGVIEFPLEPVAEGPEYCPPIVTVEWVGPGPQDEVVDPSAIRLLEKYCSAIERHAEGQRAVPC